MKRLVRLMGFVTLVTSPLAAQRAQNIEFGGFGSWWRFDRSFLIKNGFGGGASIGYNLGDRVGLEVTGDYIATKNLAETQDITVNTISGSLVLDFPAGDRLTFLASGGYSRMVFGKDPPYNFTQHMVTGGLGFRAFVGSHVAVRGDVRAQYRPDNPFFSNAFTGEVQGSAGVSYFFIPPQQGHGFNTNFQWYWGAQGGAFISKTATQPYVHEASSRAFFWIMGGLQINYSSKLNVFAHYLMTSSAPNFLLQSNTHSLQGGIRYSLGTSKEGVAERH